MGRPITLFTGQWADLPLVDLAALTQEMGFEGLELACWGNHFDVTAALNDEAYCQQQRLLLESYGLECYAISNHLVGQAVCDRIDSRHQQILPAHIWDDGDPSGVRYRATEEMKNTARAAQRFGVDIVNGFTGSSIWHLNYSFPPVSEQMIADGFRHFADSWHPILDVFAECQVRFALEVHPTEIAFDLYTAERALAAIDHRPEFGFNFDPSHFHWQGVDPVEFIRRFPDRIFHCHIKDAITHLDGRSGILSSHFNFGDYRRGWDFRSPGRGEIDFEAIIRALNDIGYEGPLSIEWEDSGMDREFGAREAGEFTRQLDFTPNVRAFDAAFEHES